MNKKIVTTAVKPVGPYSQGVIAGPFLYTSGQIALDPGTGEVFTGDIEKQTRMVLGNLKSVLQAGGASPGSVVKTTIFLSDMNDFARVNGVYETVFGDNPPARSTVQVAALPRGVGVEIEAIALIENQ